MPPAAPPAVSSPGLVLPAMTPVPWVHTPLDQQVFLQATKPDRNEQWFLDLASEDEDVAYRLHNASSR